jgi:hypothetical protein
MKFTISHTGRPRQFEAVDVLELTLHWINSSMIQKSLCLIFGITPAAVSTYLKIGLVTLNRVLHQFPDSKVRWPSKEEIIAYADSIRAREPLLPNSFGFVDGLNLKVQEPCDFFKQNAYYNGWKSGCFVSNVFVFLPTGKICFAALNKPGSWHDSTTARELYELLISHTEGNYNILADSAFPSSRELSNKILYQSKHLLR